MIMKPLVLIVLLLVLLPLLYWGLPAGLDWENTYRPAARAVAAGESPYSVEIYYAAPWAAWLLVPFAVLPESFGRLVVFLLGLCAFAFVAASAGATPLTLTLFLGSASVIGCLNNGNIEWMPLLAIVCPPWLGLILATVKPQVGIGLGLYWAITIWREEGWQAAARAVTPVTALLLVSFLWYGFWPARFTQTLAWSVDNTALGMQAVFVGAVLWVRAVRMKEARLALAAGPFLSPYVLQFTWSACLVGLLEHPRELAAAVACLWIPVLLRVFL